MNPTTLIPTLTLGQIPGIGMVTAPTSGGHVGIGIGIPIMATSVPPQANPRPQPQAQHGFSSPDSSVDFHSTHSQSPPSGCCQLPRVLPSQATWNFLAGLPYPLVTSVPSPTFFDDGTIFSGVSFLAGHPQPAIVQGPPLDRPLSFEVAIGPTLNTASFPTEQRDAIAKEIIHCKCCTLFPPTPAAIQASTREKPSGCRTVFVGGLPENMTEETVRSAFEHCGEIRTVRMSKKNFCHIRFQDEPSVEKAIRLSGYRVRIGSNSDAANQGRLHVDYAQARDDFYEWECRQRQLQREHRHRDRLEQERMLPPSPPPVVHFSEHEAATLSENIKAPDQFVKSVETLITWLERGDCSKRNAAMFYSMVQSTNSHAKRLLNEKIQCEGELRNSNLLASHRFERISIQCSQLEKVLNAASHQKAWDHFTKAQRKNIDAWKKQVVVFETLKEILHQDPEYSEMDFYNEKDDMDEPNAKKRRHEHKDDPEKLINQLKEKNDSLRCQLEAYKNEMDLIKVEFKTELEEKDFELKTLQQHHSWPHRDNQDIAATPILGSPTQSDISTQLKSRSEQESEENLIKDKSEIHCDSSSVPNTNCSSVIDSLDARLISLISTFLNVHPFGASLDYLCSFVTKVVPNVRLEQVQPLLLQYPGIFRQESTGTGANLETKWSFIGFTD